MPIQPIWPFFEGNRLDWHCCLAGSSNYSFEVKSIETWAPSFFKHNISFLPFVSCTFWFSNFCLNRTQPCFFQDLYCVRSDLGNLLKALGRLDEAKVKCARRRFSRFFGDFHSEIVWQLLPLCRQIGKSRFVYFFTTPGKLVSSPRHAFCKKRFGWSQIGQKYLILSPLADKVFGFCTQKNWIWIASSKKSPYIFGVEI